MASEGVTPEVAWKRLRPQRKLPVVQTEVASPAPPPAPKPKEWSTDELRAAVERSSDPEELLRFAKIADRHNWSQLHAAAMHRAMKASKKTVIIDLWGVESGSALPLVISMLGASQDTHRAAVEASEQNLLREYAREVADSIDDLGRRLVEIRCGASTAMQRIHVELDRSIQEPIEFVISETDALLHSGVALAVIEAVRAINLSKVMVSVQGAPVNVFAAISGALKARGLTASHADEHAKRLLRM